jgi:hypothetical protein
MMMIVVVVVVVVIIIMPWHEACIGRGEVQTGFWWGKLREGGHLEELDVNERMILKWS